MKEWIIPVLVGMGTGILSAWGVGGGTLLLLVMTLFLEVEQRTAQTINLLYFLPTAAMGLLYHRKTNVLEKKIIRSAAPWGAAAAVAGALLAGAVETDLVRKAFGVYLLFAAVSTLFRKERSAGAQAHKLSLFKWKKP